MSAAVKESAIVRTAKELDLERRRRAVCDIKLAGARDELIDDLCQAVDCMFPELQQYFLDGDSMEMARVLENVFFQMADNIVRKKPAVKLFPAAADNRPWAEQMADVAGKASRGEL